MWKDGTYDDSLEYDQDFTAITSAGKPDES